MNAVTKRRVMRKFEISEISLVDRPANEHAVAAFLKRHDEQESQMQLQKIGDDRVASFETFDQAVSHLAKLHGGRLAGMRTAARRFPSLLQKAQHAAEEQIAKAADAAKPQPVSKAVMEFEDRVDEIAKSRGVPRQQAMKKARERYPNEFEAAYGREV